MFTSLASTDIVYASIDFNVALYVISCNNKLQLVLNN